MVSDKQKISSKKWDAANMLTLGVRLRRADAERFRAWAADRGLTVNAALQAYVYACIGGKTLSGHDTDRPEEHDAAIQDKVSTR